MDGFKAKFVASVAWEKVRTFALYETERDPDGVGKGLFPWAGSGPSPPTWHTLCPGGGLMSRRRMKTTTLSPAPSRRV